MVLVSKLTRLGSVHGRSVTRRMELAGVANGERDRATLRGRRRA